MGCCEAVEEFMVYEVFGTVNVQSRFSETKQEAVKTGDSTQCALAGITRAFSDTTMGREDIPTLSRPILREAGADGHMDYIVVEQWGKEIIPYREASGLERRNVDESRQKVGGTNTEHASQPMDMMFQSQDDGFNQNITAYRKPRERRGVK
ncbi:uncharacterized protein BDZ99DRAFT_553024 [Mytilinidion resinicola]|uniref:Uncharacterized protein n=1 Tax=Mytilinidion resinicola TaxID=574789 RepID=A0A6A6XYP1_9PEZI|nr:uncharacterized protein BDZ99DRAFT_553024 [Mytilinidion resinicola]KAF2801540.1 hypothetical protein BDZ99DRAFT_553024 [Mytilinidion resinicola]